MAVSNKSYAESNQDINVSWFYLDRGNGYFVDIGAGDGKHHSNTYKLETELNWDGLCTESDVQLAEDLQQNRQVSCVTESFEARFPDEVQGQSSQQNDQGLVKKINRIFSSKKKKPKRKAKKPTPIQVSLAALLAQHKAPEFIHYLSIKDIKAGLRSLNKDTFKKYTFGYISVKQNQSDDVSDQLHQLLQKNGYLFLLNQDGDDIFIHQSVVGGVYYYKKNYSMPITVTMTDDYQVVARSDYWPDEKGTFMPKTREIAFENFGRMLVCGHSIVKNVSQGWHKRLDDE